MKEDLRYLELLSEEHPTIEQASTEIINLQSILNLPKGTEHFMSDLHGEYEAFSHVLRNGSGAVRKKINDVFGHTLGTAEKHTLATLIYYPKEKMELVKMTEKEMDNWYKVTLYRLIEVCKTVSSKYTRSKVRKALPKDYAYVIEELITEKYEVLNKEAYYDAIVDTILEIGCAEKFIIAIAELIQRLVIDRLHILGDIYDRGPAPHFIMDTLCEYHSLDIQWGNHDVVWMGAGIGQMSCIATIIKNSLRYGNLDIIEDGYGINMLPLATFAMEVYNEDPCECFMIKGASGAHDPETLLAMKMQKAITIIQFKLEGQLIEQRPEFHMENRRLLHKINWEKGTVEIEGREYLMKDCNFPTVDPKNPYELTPQEAIVMMRIQSAFRNCEKLQKHIMLLLKKGSLYKVYNGNLLYHGCIPMTKEGEFKEVSIYGTKYKGKALYDALEAYVRKAFFSLEEEEQRKGQDILWYLWNAPESPLFGRDKMATFERYFLFDEEIKAEKKNEYYRLIQKPAIADKILKEFGLNGDKVHIINGHVPVHQKAGESPIKCDGKVIVIDGGFCRAYQKETGIAGYTLIYNSYGLTLTAHDSFESAEAAISQEWDLVSRQVAVEHTMKRILVGDTDNGLRIQERIISLKELIKAYRLGILVEKDKGII